jgi:hypothetical protein
LREIAKMPHVMSFPRLLSSRPNLSEFLKCISEIKRNSNANIIIEIPAIFRKKECVKNLVIVSGSTEIEI